MQAAARFTGHKAFASRLSTLVHKGHMTAFWEAAKMRVCDTLMALAPRSSRLVALIVDTCVGIAYVVCTLALAMLYVVSELCARACARSRGGQGVSV